MPTDTVAAGATIGRSHLKGDISGGITAGVLTIPVSMGYGLLALQPLGEGYLSYGIVAGLMSAIVVLLACALLGGSAGLMYTPRSVVTLVMATVVLEGVAHGPAAIAARGDVGRTLTLVFFVVFTAGLFQALFGAVRLGRLIRYIPSPVMSGFQNAAAVLILLSQVDTLLGFRRHIPLSAIASNLAAVQPLTLAVGVLTCVGMWYGPRLAKRIPSTLLGLFIGTAAYYALAAAGYQALLGPVIGPLPSALPVPRYLAGFASLPAEPGIWPILLTLAVGAFGLAVVSSLDVLLCARVMDGVTGERSSGPRELVRIGLGNVTAACFGGIPSGVNLGASFANFRSGGRTRLAAVIAAAVILLAVLLLSPAIAVLPRVVVAGMLVVVGIQLFDRSSFQLLTRVLGRQLLHRRGMVLDLLVVILVATTILVFDPVVGVGMGVALAVMFFLVRMSKSVVRRMYHGDVVRSRKSRDPKLMELLAAHGRQIVVFELEGPIFFGTAEDLATRAEEPARGGGGFVVLDFKRVNELDSTGARILLHINDRLKQRGGCLLLSHTHDNHLVSNVLRDLGVTGALGHHGSFVDTDAALEFAEDRLILAHAPGIALHGEMPVDRLSVFDGLTEAECAVVRAVLLRRTYDKDETLIQEGSRDRDLFLMARGVASVKVELPGQGRQRRVASFTAGTVFGEVALLDQQPRSASVTADEEVVCYVLSEDAFRALVRDHQAIAIQLLTNLGSELSRRLRRANAMISELEG
ncbi:MAG TPA: SulP family inorganic anion transporter [Methylomirabilota bacterium]|nr:SulP family inorganic anion transporter [Methylomirabilota bacterium]